jgi:Fe-S cluster assembly scaffold protein SufB
VPLQKRLGNVEAPKVAMDYVWDSASILTSFREELSKFGVVFCSISEAIKEYPDLVRQHLGSVVSSRRRAGSPLLGWSVNIDIFCTATSKAYTLVFDYVSTLFKPL